MNIKSTSTATATGHANMDSSDDDGSEIHSETEDIDDEGMC